MKIIILGTLFLAIALVTIRPSFAQIFIPDDVHVTYAVKKGGELIEKGKLTMAWNLYKNCLTQKENIDHDVIETEPGYYQNAQTIILKKMAQILEDPKVPFEAQADVEVFYKNFISPRNFLMENEEGRKEFIKKSRLYLSSREGFQRFNDMGSVYFEEGDCEKALSLWSEAKDISLGYKNLNKKEKIIFSAKLGFCYKQLGWNDKLKALFKENPELTQLEEKRVLSGLKRVTELLKNLNAYAQICPVVVDSPALPQKFIIQRKEINIKDETYSQDELCLRGRVNWCYKKDEYRFLSKQLVLNNAVYIVAASHMGDLILLTLDKKTGNLLNEQFIAVKMLPGGWIESTPLFYPYKLSLKDGKIELTTEVGHHEFNLDGTTILAIDFISHAEGLALKNQHFAEELFPRLTQALSNSNPEIRLGAAYALGRIGKAAEAAIPRLTQVAISDSNANVRSISADALGSMSEAAKAAIPQLTQALSDFNPDVRSSAAYALGSMSDVAEAAIPRLTQVAISDSNANVRMSAAYALGRMSDVAEAAIPRLTQAISDSNPEIRRRATHALGRIGKAAEAAIPQLTQVAISDSDATVRMGAAYALGRMSEAAKAAIPQLTQALLNSNPEVRLSAAYALGYMGKTAQSAVPELTKALKDPDAAVRRTAQKALVNISK